MKDSLSWQLERRIVDSGPLRFDEFMQTALYDPAQGFYSSGRTRTGTQGDFLTPVSAGPVLGQLLARQADEWHAALGRPASVSLCEQGADRGLLAADLLSAIRSHHPLLRAAVRFHLIEPTPALTQQQKQTLEPLEKTFPVQWHPSLETWLPGDVPCFFYSCELIDSFPVRLARHTQGKWQELGVSFANGSFIWSSQDVPEDLLTQLQRWQVPAAEGYNAEIRPSAGPWIRSLAKRMRQGMALTLDYGRSATELYHPSRSGGSLVALRQHLRSQNPLQDPGHQDLTAHVNYTELILEGRREGLAPVGLVDFSSAWTRLARPLLAEDQPLPQKWIRNFQHLTHPGFFGRTHQVLVQGKNLPDTFQPSICHSAEEKRS